MFIKFVRYVLLMKNKLTQHSIIPTFQVLLACALLFTSCKKEGSIGLGTQPATDLVNAEFKDTSTVLSYITREDSVNTNNTGYTLIGSYNDPEFGTASGSLFTQWNLPNNQTAVDLTGGVGGQPELVLDSIVLTLQYTSTLPNLRRYYGTLEPQTFRVCRISEAMSVDSVYYSDHKILFDSLNPLAVKTFTPQPDSFVTIKGVKKVAHLRIKLDSIFGDSIMKQSATANLASTAAFQTFFKGLCIIPTNGTQLSGEGSILYFALAGAETRLHLYYRRNTISGPVAGDTLTYSFEVGSTSSHFTQFRHDYSTSAFASKVDNVADTDFVYIQSMAGMKTKIVFPYIKDLVANNSIAINQAQVVFKVDGSKVSTNYDTHPQLFLMALDSLNKPNFPLDYYDSHTGYGGAYNSATQDYKFNITRHLQAILDGSVKDYGFILIAAGSAVNGNREVLKGAGKNSDKLKLRLTYTKVN